MSDFNESPDAPKTSAEGSRLFIYVAAPLFTPAERSFNEYLAAHLSEMFEVFLPQRDGQLLVRMIENGTSIAVATGEVFRADIAAIRRAAIIVAVLDGRTIDEGVAFELGFAYALGKRCIGLQSDARRLLPFGNNPMIDGALEATLPSIEAVLSHLRLRAQL